MDLELKMKALDMQLQAIEKPILDQLNTNVTPRHFN
jgi:hypothetical protein